MGRIEAAIVAGGALFLALVLLVFLHEKGGEQAPRLAPEVDLARADGTRMSLGDLRGKTVLVHFWATWCPPCAEETPALEALYRRLGPRGLEVVAISVDDAWAEVRRFVADHGVTYPVLLDPTADTAHRYGTMKYPETYVVDSGGRIIRKYVGAQDWAAPDMAAAIEATMGASSAPR
jgi:peroxiredoxin